MYGDFHNLTGCIYCGSASGHKAGCPNESPAEKVGSCELCSRAIHSGDTVYVFEGAMYHTDCFDDEYAKEV